VCVVPRHRGSADIHIDNINMTLLGRELLVEANLALNWGHRCVRARCTRAMCGLCCGVLHVVVL
jgi:hypothetical protein